MKKLLSIIAALVVTASFAAAAPSAKDTVFSKYALSTATTSAIIDYNTYGNVYVKSIELTNATTCYVLFDILASTASLGLVGVKPGESTFVLSIEDWKAHFNVVIATSNPVTSNGFMAGTTANATAVRVNTK